MKNGINAVEKVFPESYKLVNLTAIPLIELFHSISKSRTAYLFIIRTVLSDQLYSENINSHDTKR